MESMLTAARAASPATPTPPQTTGLISCFRSNKCSKSGLGSSSRAVGPRASLVSASPQHWRQSLWPFPYIFKSRTGIGDFAVPSQSVCGSAATPGPVVPSSRVPLFSARCDGSRGESFHLLSVLVGDYRCFRMFHPTALEFVSFPNDLWWPNRKRRFRLLRISWYGGVIIVRTRPAKIVAAWADTNSNANPSDQERRANDQ